MAAAYDAIVAGLGAMGSAAVYHLASRGLRVLGLDAHSPGHTRGSSHEAGFLRPERCIETQLRLGSRAGAALHHGEPLVSWRPDGDGVEVRTAADTYRAGKLVLTTGAWIGRHLMGIAGERLAL